MAPLASPRAYSKGLSSSTSEDANTPSIVSNQPWRRVSARRQLSRNSAMRYTFFKTELCRYYEPGQQGLRCGKGLGCPFAHGPQELRSRPDLTKTSLCQLFRKGKCRKGEMCPFAHGAKELRTRETPQLLTDLGLESDDVEASPVCGSCSESSLPLGDSPAASLVDEKMGTCRPKPSACCPRCQRPGHSEYSRFCAWCGIGLVEGKVLYMAKAAAAAAAAAAPRSSHLSRRRFSGGRPGAGGAAKATVRARSRALSQQEVPGGSRPLESSALKPDAPEMALAQAHAPEMALPQAHAPEAMQQVTYVPQVSYVECVPVYVPVMMPYQFGMTFPVVNKGTNYTELYED